MTNNSTTAVSAQTMAGLAKLTDPTTYAIGKLFELLDELLYQLAVAEKIEDEKGEKLDEVYIWSLADKARDTLDDLEKAIAR